MLDPKQIMKFNVFRSNFLRKGQRHKQGLDLLDVRKLSVRVCSSPFLYGSSNVTLSANAPFASLNSRVQWKQSPSFSFFQENHARTFSFSCHDPDDSEEKILDSVREKMPFDVLIVGGGPSGLAASIRLKQLCQENQVDLSICVIEKGR
jgi:hypothetical protein